MINGNIFTHERTTLGITFEYEWEGGLKHQVSVSIHDPCPFPSRKSHFIARWTIAPLSIRLATLHPRYFSGSVLHANCPIHFAVWWLFTTIPEMGVHVSSFLWGDISPCLLIILRHIHRSEKDLKRHFPRNLCVRRTMHEVNVNCEENLHRLTRELKCGLRKSPSRTRFNVKSPLNRWAGKWNALQVFNMHKRYFSCLGLFIILAPTNEAKTEKFLLIIHNANVVLSQGNRICVFILCLKAIKGDIWMSAWPSQIT